MKGSQDVSASQIAKLDKTNVLPNAFIFLYGCGTAARCNQPRIGEYLNNPIPANKVSRAQAFANHFNTQVFGFEPHVSPGEIPWMSFRRQNGHNFGNFLGVQYFHNGHDVVHPRVRKPGGHI